MNEVELAASKRKIQELEVAAAQPDPKKLKHHIPGKLDRSLESFLGSTVEVASQANICFFVPRTAAIGVFQQYVHVALICSFIKILDRGSPITFVIEHLIVQREALVQARTRHGTG